MFKMNTDKPSLLKRVGAYLIDLIVVGMLASIITMIFFNSSANQKQADQITQLTDLTSSYEEKKITEDEYNKKLDELIERLSKEDHDESVEEAITITKQYASLEIEKKEYDEKMEALIQKLTEEGVPLASVRLLQLVNKYKNGEINGEEYSKEYSVLNYYVTKENMTTSIAFCSIGLIYYVIMCFFCHGITLGKYFMKLRIVSSNDNELNIGHYLIRGLLVNLILSNLISIIFVLAMNKDTFIAVYPKVNMVLTFFLLGTMLFMMYRNDGRGLHDILSNTKVISTKEPKVKEEVKEEIVEAKVIEEKKETKKTKKTGGKKK